MSKLHFRIIFCKGSLERILPCLNFIDVTEGELETYRTGNAGKVTSLHDTGDILIADNSFIGPMIYNENLPFKFIQECS